MGLDTLILLDTHVILWWQAGGARLSARAKREVDRADALLVSPVSFWEISRLLDKGRIELDRERYVWMSDFLSGDRVELAPLTPTAAMAAGHLPERGFEGDHADALLYATAREHMAPFISKDQAIRRYAAASREVAVIW